MIFIGKMIFRSVALMHLSAINSGEIPVVFHVRAIVILRTDALKSMRRFLTSSLTTTCMVIINNEEDSVCKQTKSLAEKRSGSVVQQHKYLRPSIHELD